MIHYPHIVAWLRIERVGWWGSKKFGAVECDPTDPDQKPDAILIRCNCLLWLAYKDQLYREVWLGARDRGTICLDLSNTCSRYGWATFGICSPSHWDDAAAIHKLLGEWS